MVSVGVTQKIWLLLFNGAESGGLSGYGSGHMCGLQLWECLNAFARCSSCSIQH